MLGTYANQGILQRMPREKILNKYTAGQVRKQTGANGGKAAGKESESSCTYDYRRYYMNKRFFVFFGIVKYRMAGCRDRFFRGSHANSLIIMNCKARSSQPATSCFSSNDNNRQPTSFKT